MLERRRIHTSSPVRSSLANVAFAVEERVVWGSADALRAVAEVIRWPFERAAWAIERVLIWPLRERAGVLSDPLRRAGAVALGLVAVGAGVLGFAWAAGSGSKSQNVDAAAPTPAAAPVVRAAPPAEHLAEAAPVLHGATPSFKATATGGIAAAKAHGKAADGATASTSPDTATESSAAPASSTAAKTAEVVPAGPAANKVARRFADAFVLYETGQNDAGVRTVFAATATPHLARSLLHRPPRLPANVEVPQAKVLNVVPGPKHGDTYTLSVSLLRVGITSELRIDMQRNEKSGRWQVTDVRG
jgi:hypothetical protein